MAAMTAPEWSGVCYVCVTVVNERVGVRQKVTGSEQLGDNGQLLLPLLFLHLSRL